MSTKNTKPSRTAKTTKNAVAEIKPSSAQTSKTAASPDGEETELVRVTDLTGVAWVYLPEALRGLIGEAAYQMQVAALECSSVTVIGRHPGDVVYVHLPVMVANDQRPATSPGQAAQPAVPQQQPI